MSWGSLPSSLRPAPLPSSPVAQPVQTLPSSPVAQAVPMPVASAPRYSTPSSGGGGYSPYLPPVAGPPATPTPSLTDSPTYQAFLRELGLEESQAQTATNDRVDALRRQLARDWA